MVEAVALLVITVQKVLVVGAAILETIILLVCPNLAVGFLVQVVMEVMAVAAVRHIYYARGKHGIQ